MIPTLIGIHDWCVFQALLNFIAQAVPDGVKLSKFQMVIMFSIRLNLYDEDIAYRFGVHVSIEFSTHTSRSFCLYYWLYYLA